MAQKSGKILIVDDDPEIIKLVKLILKNTKHTLSSAQNGKTALTELEKQNFDLLLVDRLMPRMDGISFIKMAKNELKLDIPVILMSAHDMEDKGLTEIFDLIYDIIPKPFTAFRLKMIIRNALQYQSLQKKYVTLIKSVINDSGKEYF